MHYDCALRILILIKEARLSKSILSGAKSHLILIDRKEWSLPLYPGTFSRSYVVLHNPQNFGVYFNAFVQLDSPDKCKRRICQILCSTVPTKGYISAAATEHLKIISYRDEKNIKLIIKSSTTPMCEKNHLERQRNEMGETQNLIDPTSGIRTLIYLLNNRLDYYRVKKAIILETAFLHKTVR